MGQHALGRSVTHAPAGARADMPGAIPLFPAMGCADTAKVGPGAARLSPIYPATRSWKPGLGVSVRFDGGRGGARSTSPDWSGSPCPWPAGLVSEQPSDDL